MDIVAELIKLGMVGIIAGLFSSFLANRDHRHRKWWELRVDAYQNSIEAISDLVYYFDRHYSAESEYRELPEEIQTKLRANWELSYTKIRRMADSGAFLFSDRANTALKAFMRDDNEQCYIEALDNNLAKANACLLELVACSKEDLKLKENWLARFL